MKISVTLTPEIGLEKALKKASVNDPATVTSLAIVGTITDHIHRNTDDLQYIRENMRETLLELDLSETLFEDNYIYSYALFNCSGLKTVTIPDSVIEIYKSAFEGCTGLTSLTIPRSVIGIEKDAFKRCKAIITVHPDNPVYTVRNRKIEFKKVKTTGQIGNIEWTLSNRVLTIKTNGAISDFDDYSKSWDADESHSTWFPYRKLINKIVFKRDTPKVMRQNPYSVTFKNWTVPNYSGSSIGVYSIIDRAFQGYISTDLWSLYSWFSVQIPRMIRNFKRDSICHPASMTSEEWDAILDRLAFCISEMAKPGGGCEFDEKMRTYREEMINEGFELLCKNFRNLWW